MAGHAATEDIHGHPALQHHFENMEQQREAGTLGMWVFLVTEIMFFGGMFLAYALYRTQFPAAFASASNHLDIYLGAVNTGVLILSSFTMAMAVYFTQIGKRRPQVLVFSTDSDSRLDVSWHKGRRVSRQVRRSPDSGHLIPGHPFNPVVQKPAKTIRTSCTC